MSVMNSSLKFLTFAVIFAIGAGTLAGAQDALSSEKKQEKKHDQVAATTSLGAEAVEEESGHGTTAVKKKKKTGGHGVKWGYEGKTGPGQWASLSADYELCGRGTMQSPIDMAGMSTATTAPIAFDYNLTPLDVVHNGHTVQVNYQPGSSITVGGKRYELLQYHFHSPSEHSVAGRLAAMEVHFVHQGAEGELAVVGIMIESGADNPALREPWAVMPKKAGKAKVKGQILVNGRDLLPHDTSYYRYMGSLTTPPCSEGVNWYLLTNPISASMEQIHQFAAAVDANNRPTQAVNNRLVLAPMAGE